MQFGCMIYKDVRETPATFPAIPEYTCEQQVNVI